METQYTKTQGNRECSSKKKVHRNKCLHLGKKQRYQINNVTVHLKELEVRRTNEAQIQQKEGKLKRLEQKQMKQRPESNRKVQ